jgi:dUTP pyrophosphatase
MELKFKKLSDKAVLPTRAYKSDAGLDLTCTSISTGVNECGQLMLVYHTGLAVEIPQGHVGLLFPRSSINKKSLALTNSVGVIDSGYRGEIMAVFKSTTDVVPAIYKEGERFCQLVIVAIPEIEVIESDALAETDRGENGYGSSGSNNAEVSPVVQDAPNSTDAEDVEGDTCEEADASPERVS